MQHVRVLQVVVLACGCGGNPGHSPDAGTPADGAPDSAPRAPVTLDVLRGDQPVAGVHVYFLNPDDTVAATVDTDAAGKASAKVADGGSVTVLDAFAPAQPDPTRAIELRTYLGVKAGDHLRVTQRDRTEIDVTIKAPPLATRHSYDVLTTCGTQSMGSQSSATVGLAGCHGVADIMVVATTATDRVALYHAGAAVADGATVDLTAETFRPYRDTTFHLSNVPSDATGVSVLHGFVSEHGTMGFNNIVFDGSAGDIGADTTVSFPVPDVDNVSAVIDFTIDVKLHHVVTVHRPLAASYDLDVTGLLLPDRSSAPHFDPTSRSIAWQDAPGGTAPDLAFASLAVTPAPPLTAAPTQPWTWLVVAPYTAGAIHLPALPADVNTWVPAATDTVRPDVVTFKSPGGYDAIRSLLFDEISGDDFDRKLGPDDHLLKLEN